MGFSYFEVGYDQAPAVRAIMEEQGFQDLQTTMDPGMHWRVVGAEPVIPRRLPGPPAKS